MNPQKGDVIVCGEAFAKARDLFDDSGAIVDKAGPSTAVQVFVSIRVPLRPSDKLSSGQCNSKVSSASNRGISASDVDLAVAAGKSIIIGFNVKVPNALNSHADNKGVEIQLYRVIYELIHEESNGRTS
ncbi:hypothetical protein MKX03_037285 [Papaver bracteatum]|nr:hypothetical protein MKX03_037285 [Papaver bracteatum]